MPRIFISYRRADSSSAAGRLYKELRRAFGKREIFKDVENIPLGKDFRGVIHDATVRCRVMLVVIGPDWLTSKDDAGKRRLDDPEDFVRIEIETGLKRPGIAVIPVLVEGARMPKPHHLPNSLRELSFKNAFTIHDDPLFDHDLHTLVQELRPVVRIARGGWLLRFVAALLTLILIAVGALWLSRSVDLRALAAEDIPVINPDAPLRLVYDDDKLVLYNRSGQPVNVSKYIFRQRRAGGSLTFEATRWATTSRTALPAGDCLMLWELGVDDMLTPNYCDDRQAWFAVGSTFSFWLSADSTATFDVLRAGEVVATCPVNHGDCGITLG